MKNDATTNRSKAPAGQKTSAYWVLFSILSLVAFLSFWLFSRFTVDDAFISWSYGKNLIDSGVWGYNPTSFDLTQAYTNPIYAALSIIPNYLGIDIVLFFKVVSLLLLFIFGVWFSKRTRLGIFVVLLYALPATFIHAFSGLETFLYVALVTALIVFLIEDKFWESIACALLLFMTRPESWVLLGLVPLFYAIPKSMDEGFSLSNIKSAFYELLSFRRYRFKSSLLALALLLVPMLAYYAFHKMHFGYALPNTFYVKSSGFFSLQDFIYFSFMAAPIVGILFAGKFRVFLVTFLFFCAIIFSYSTSSLAMNYIDRFAFHIFVPAYLSLVYVSANLLSKEVYVSDSSSFHNFYVIKYKNIALLVAFMWISVFGVNNLSASSLVHIANYYPRALDAHADLGKAIREESAVYDIDTMSFGDAGMAAYHSGISSLDNIGLGSAMVAHEGINKDTLDSYRPEIIVFHARPDQIRLGSHNQKKIHDWAIKNEYNSLCQVFWKKNYTLNIYSKYDLENVEDVCDSSSRVNNLGDKEYFLNHGTRSPWSFWKS